MKVLYRESRVSAILLLMCVVLQAVVLLFTFRQALPFAATIGGSLAIFLIFILFFSYRVTICDDSLYILYGIGLFRREVPLSLVASSEIVPNNSLSWIYDPFNPHVLRLHMRGGGSTYVSIRDPKHLQQMIRAVMRG